jgi:hypothetical protein
MKKYQPLPYDILPESIERPWVTEKKCSRAKEIESLGNDPELQTLMGEGGERGSADDDAVPSDNISLLSRPTRFDIQPHGHDSKANRREQTSCKEIASLRRSTLYPGLERLVCNETSPGWPITSFGWVSTDGECCG